ncbi:hypothetical protein ABZ907_03540 [Nonomuraea wenchangensis]
MALGSDQIVRNLVVHPAGYAVAYGSYAVVALALVVIAVIAWRRRSQGIVVMQAVAVVAVLAVIWEPYVPLH